MTEIWTEQGFVANDPWVIETEEMRAGENQRALLSIDDAVAAAEAGRTGLGVIIRPADDAGRLAPHLDALALVAVAFPAFNDGRGFSHATRLRTRIGYQGPLRAVGDVLIDQVPLMLRVGFDSFAVTNPVAIRRLSEGRLPGIRHHYQPTVRDAADPGSYAWRRIAK